MNTVESKVNGNVEALVQYLKVKKPKNIIVLCGAGISHPFGKVDTSYFGAQKTFDLHNFRRDPRPLYAHLLSIWTGTQVETVSHALLKCLFDHKMLLRIYTENIDGLELQAGIPRKKIVQLQGGLEYAHCCSCKMTYDLAEFKTLLDKYQLPTCRVCGTSIKPNIILEDEPFNDSMLHQAKQDFPMCDLLLVIGTSLKTQLLIELLNWVPKTTKRVLINKTKVAERLKLSDLPDYADLKRALDDPQNSHNLHKNRLKLEKLERQIAGIGFEFSESVNWLQPNKEGKFRDLLILQDCHVVSTEIAKQLSWHLPAAKEATRPIYPALDQWKTATKRVVMNLLSRFCTNCGKQGEWSLTLKSETGKLFCNPQCAFEFQENLLVDRVDRRYDTESDSIVQKRGFQNGSVPNVSDLDQRIMNEIYTELSKLSKPLQGIWRSKRLNLEAKILKTLEIADPRREDQQQWCLGNSLDSEEKEHEPLIPKKTSLPAMKQEAKAMSQTLNVTDPQGFYQTLGGYFICMRKLILSLFETQMEVLLQYRLQLLDGAEMNLEEFKLKLCENSRLLSKNTKLGIYKLIEPLDIVESVILKVPQLLDQPDSIAKDNQTIIPAGFETVINIVFDCLYPGYKYQQMCTEWTELQQRTFELALKCFSLVQNHHLGTADTVIELLNECYKTKVIKTDNKHSPLLDASTPINQHETKNLVHEPA